MRVRVGLIICIALPIVASFGCESEEAATESSPQCFGICSDAGPGSGGANAGNTGGANAGNTGGARTGGTTGTGGANVAGAGTGGIGGGGTSGTGGTTNTGGVLTFDGGADA